ncbi:MAG TPA: type IV toxin-antitoxin system AbiEi family antitoxin [bacterium]|nr:type IV toxin-antitoxin system AbiEi family antitoxin [bacterium]
MTTLYENGQTIFSLNDVERITGFKPAHARSFIHKLVTRALATRLRPGLFILVPFELGHDRQYLGNPYVVGRELVGAKDYYVSHASAMDIHGMTTQPHFVVYITRPKVMRSRTILGTEFRFLYCRRPRIFGTVEHWVDKQEKVMVSDLERTILDGLRQPRYCGGVTEVAKGLWMRRADMDVHELIDYALRLNIGAVTRRLGYLLETYGIGTSSEVQRLRGALTLAYASLDPLLPPGGKFLARWRLRLNVPLDELQTVVRT